jgi:shikimate kinase
MGKKTQSFQPFPENIVLIGMFGSGKSTVGKILAEKLRYHCVDVDRLIEMKYRKPLGRVYQQLGMKKFMKAEEGAIQALRSWHCVLAPGGSAVYYPKAMRSLQKLGPIVYLKVPLAELKKRLPDWSNRGVVCRGKNTLPAVYRERAPLFKKYADLTVDASGRSFEKIALKILAAFGKEEKASKKR